MAGVLSFTLGLETSNFLRGLGLASGGILSLSGVMSGLGRIVSGTWEAIERGGALVDLQNRTGESVRNLYQLQEAFKVVGVGSDSVAPMLLKLQRAMSGVDDSGGRIEETFSAMGINLKTLQSLDAPRQFEVLAAAINKLPRDQATALSARIFGREGTGNFLQIARDFKGFQASLRDSSASADVVARTAAAFDEIGDSVTTIKTKIGGMFAGIAEGAAPALQSILDFVNGVDWVSIGQNIGTMLNGLVQAFKLGELGGLMMEAFKAAFDSLPSLALAGLQKLGVMLLKVFETPLLYLQTGIDYAVDQAVNNPIVRTMLAMTTQGASEKMFASVGIGAPGSTTSWEQMFSERKQRGLEFFIDGMGLNELNAGADEALGKAFEGFKERFSGIWDRIAELGASGFNVSMTKPGPGGDSPILGGKAAKSEVSDWEKMGFVMRGGNAGSDYARNTAENTKTMVGLIRETNRHLAGTGSGASFANK